MTYKISHIGSRECARCHRDLTDAASMEAGIGPICRELDNKLLAQQIPAVVALAVASFATINAADFAPEALATLADVEGAINAPGADAQTDWRKTVKRIEWILSTSPAKASREALFATVAALGYVALVALWKGEGTTGEATAYHLDGRLYFVGPRCNGGKAALRKIAGWKFHGYGAPGSNGKPAWSVPAAAHEAFRLAVITNWPGTDFNALAGAVEGAKAFEAAQPAPVVLIDQKPAQAPCEAPAPAATVEKGGALLSVRSPYNKTFIEKLKALVPYVDRRWNGAAKVWEVSVKHEAPLMALIAECYGAPPAVIPAAA